MYSESIQACVLLVTIVTDYPQLIHVEWFHLSLHLKNIKKNVLLIFLPFDTLPLSCPSLPIDRFVNHC